MIDYETAAEELHEQSADQSDTFDAAKAIVDAALEGAAVYREADDCQITKSHSLGEHGKPCLECGAEQIWVLPATKENRVKVHEMIACAAGTTVCTSCAEKEREVLTTTHVERVETAAKALLHWKFDARIGWDGTEPYVREYWREVAHICLQAVEDSK